MNCQLQRKEISRCLKKQSFEHQMLFEFKRFTDGMLSKMDEQNKLLSQLVLSKKNRTTLPFSPSKVSKSSMINAKQNPTEINAKLWNTV